MRQFPAIGAALLLVFAAACSADEGVAPEEASADAPANAAAEQAPIVVAEATETPAAPEATTGDFDPNRFQAGKLDPDVHVIGHAKLEDVFAVAPSHEVVDFERAGNHPEISCGAIGVAIQRLLLGRLSGDFSARDSGNRGLA